jgi:N-acetylmuramoyl-L-alanine amidase
MRKLLIDTGHSRRFPGAFGWGDEVSFTREVAKWVLQLIDSKKYSVIQVPDGFAFAFSSNANLVKRIKWINDNASPQDWLLSIHANGATSPEVRGITTAYLGGYECMRLKAKALTKAVVDATDGCEFSRGVMADTESRFGRIGILRDTEPMALLVECGFCSNRDDMSINPKKYAQGIANFFNTL